jgi:phage terminase small subunit
MKSGPPSGSVPPKGVDRELTPQQEMFAYEYVKDFNATQAAIRAGYSAKTAGSKGTQLLQVVSVRSLIERLREDLRKRAKMTSDEILEELAKMARSNIRNAFVADMVDDGNGNQKRRVRMLDPLEMEADAAAAIAGIEVVNMGDDSVVLQTTKIKHWDKHAALRTLAQIHKLIGAEVEVNLGNELAQRLAAARKRARKE